MIPKNTIHNTDCLVGMKDIPDGSIDMVLSDLPYNCLACKWDKPIDLPSWWEYINRIVKDNGAIVLTAYKIRYRPDQQNKKMFRFDLI